MELDSRTRGMVEIEVVDCTRLIPDWVGRAVRMVRKNETLFESPDSSRYVGAPLLHAVSDD